LILIFSFSTENNRQKFEYIYQTYKNLLLHKAYGVLKDYMLAEDAVSEAFIRIYKNLHKIDDPASNKSIAFIVTIAKNVSLTMLSKEKGKVVELFDESQQDEFDLEQYILSEVSTEGIYALLDGIGEELKSVFLLKYAYDMSHRDIGKALGITENNVTVRLHRAKKKLTAILVKEGYAYEQA